MDQVISILKIALPFLYGMALIGYISLMLGQGRTDGRAGKATSALLLFTVLVHTGYMVLLGASLGHHPMATFFQLLSFISLAIALVYLWLEHREKNRSTGVFVLPFVVFLQGVAAVGIDHTGNIHTILKTTPFGMHTGSLMLAYVSFFLSTVYGLMLLLFYRAMQKNEFGILFEKLPPLSTLARMNLRAAVAGIVFMTPGIAAGLYWAASKVDFFWTDPKIYFTLAVWLAWSITLVGHYFFKWNDRRVAIASLIAFGFLIVLTVLHHAVLGGWHHFIG